MAQLPFPVVILSLPLLAESCHTRFWFT
jgi:hypothetical protein